MTTSTVAPQVGGPTENARKELESWGVIIGKGEEPWGEAELQRIQFAFSQAPDKTILNGVGIFLDKERSDGTEASTHAFVSYCKAEPSGKIHIHFYHQIFKDYPEKDWRLKSSSVKSSLLVPLHELGHVLVKQRYDPQSPDALLRESKDLFDLISKSLGDDDDALRNDLGRAHKAFSNLINKAYDFEFLPTGTALENYIELRRKKRKEAGGALLLLEARVATLRGTVARRSPKSPNDPTNSTVAKFCANINAGMDVIKKIMAAQGTLEVFALKARAEKFQPFTNYCKRDIKEWFAETYAMFILSPDRLPNEKPAYLRTWFAEGCPAT